MTSAGRSYSIASIPGDGIGPETVAAAQRVLDAVSADAGFRIEWKEYPWGCDHYLATGAMMTEGGLAELSLADAILLGAVGRPDVPDHISLWGLLIPIRRGFDQYISLRPVRLLDGVESPLAPGRNQLDVVIVRENTEGEYSEIGGRIFRGRPDEMAIQEAVFTRTGIERVARFAFDLAQQRSGSVASATKSNGIIHTMPFWDEVVEDVAADYPDVVLTRYHVDALAALLVLEPGKFDVILGSNLFGDILSDLTAALAGSIGIAPCGNIDPSRRFPSMFEPIHGSAPDIVGLGVANPVGQIWSSVLMLRHLGEHTAATRLEASIASVLQRGIRTPDLGGSQGTVQVTDAIISAYADSES